MLQAQVDPVGSYVLIDSAAMSVTEVAKELGDRWRKLDAKEKSVRAPCLYGVCKCPS
jgi:hypothetical protein